MLGLDMLYPFKIGYDIINQKGFFTMNFDFYKRLALVGKRIPYGKVVTYGQLAMLCGKPQNARQIGYALRASKVTSAFPAHRVVNGKGHLSGAASFATPDWQKQSLKQEGVHVDIENNVDLKTFQWHHSFDDAMEFYNLFEELSI